MSASKKITGGTKVVVLKNTEVFSKNEKGTIVKQFNPKTPEYYVVKDVIGWTDILKLGTHFKVTPTRKSPSTSGTITRNGAVELIRKSNGKIFTVTFRKKPQYSWQSQGELRTMTCRTGTSTGIKGTGRNNAKALGYITVYEMSSRGYKNVNAQTITGLKINGKTYKVK